MGPRDSGLSVGRAAGKAEVGPRAVRWAGVQSAPVLFASKLAGLHLEVLGIRRSGVFCGVGLGGRGWWGAGESGNLVIT